MHPSVLRHCALFETLSSDQLAKVEEIASPRDYQAGEGIFREGALGDVMYVVVNGTVRISKEIPGARDLGDPFQLIGGERLEEVAEAKHARMHGAMLAREAPRTSP